MWTQKYRDNNGTFNVFHEFRNIPNEFEDYVGMSLDAPYLMHTFSYDLQLAPSRIKVDFKTMGGNAETNNWNSLHK